MKTSVNPKRAGDLFQLDGLADYRYTHRVCMPSVRILMLVRDSIRKKKRTLNF